MTGNPAPQQPGERRPTGPASPAGTEPTGPDQGGSAVRAGTGGTGTGVPAAVGRAAAVGPPATGSWAGGPFGTPPLRARGRARVVPRPTDPERSTDPVGPPPPPTGPGEPAGGGPGGPAAADPREPDAAEPDEATEPHGPDATGPNGPEAAEPEAAEPEAAEPEAAEPEAAEPDEPEAAEPNEPEAGAAGAPEADGAWEPDRGGPGGSVRGEGPSEISTSIEVTTGARRRDLPRRVPLRSAMERLASARSEWDPGADPSGEPTADEPAFWLPIEEVHWDGRPVQRETRSWFERRRADRADRRRAARPKGPRDPRYGLPGLLAVTLVAGFFAWVSAEPLWLAVGHGDRGTATVTWCTGHGLNLSCRGDFTPADRTFTARGVPLSGLGPAQRGPGAQVGARMVGADGARAYADTGFGRQLRWLLGLLVTLACGPVIVWVTGALRLPELGTRRGAAAAGLAGPVLITAGFLAATY
ncbi:hypothetical protein [Micromonospora zhanjiangensis]|uniref:Uncharacterized protein n=1 Tax=Micromonospora zhanjiangensis TaxID=1522057 RepID=A0ABV8KFB5_9ACTN